jgi:putative N6-adenine-specific DNA methylase
MMNLEKRIKRHVIGPRHTLFAVTLPGCEEVCRRELNSLSDTIDVDRVVQGGVLFSGRLTDVYRANLHLRTAGRVLMRIASFKATAFHRLERQLAALPWSIYLPAGALPSVRAAAHRSRLHHTGAIEARVTGTIRSHWSEMQIPLVHNADQCVFIRLEDDRVTVSIDSSGENLYRRGLKTHSAQAPLRETTAAFILTFCGYRPDRLLLDPMCGSGTFSLEAAMMAKRMPPGFHRCFAFLQWPAFRSRQWDYLKRTAGQAIQQVQHPVIHASDRDEKACDDLKRCASCNGLEDAIQVRSQDFFDLRVNACKMPPGLIVLNPPYGRRLGTQTTPAMFYRKIAAKLTRDFKGWQLAMLIPDRAMARALPLKLRPFPLRHGGLDITLLTGKIE